MKAEIISDFQVKCSKQRLLFIFLIGIWIAYSLIHTVLNQSQETRIYAGFLTLIAQVGFALSITLLTFFLWKKTTGLAKTIFALFSVSFLLLTIADANYNITVNILAIKYSITDRIPFIGFLIFQLITWITVFLKSRPHQNSHSLYLSYLPVVLIILIIFTIFFLSHLTWNVQGFSAIGLYSLLLEAMLQIIGFVFASLCLAVATNKQIRFISVGYLIIIASNFAGSNHLTRSLLALSWTEVMWLLGLVLIVFGFYNMNQKTSELKIGKWLNYLNSLQAQCAFWSFLFCMLLLTAFCGIFIGYNFQLFPLQYLLSALITFSVLAVIISSVFARILSSQFEKIEAIITSYMDARDADIIHRRCNNNIHEFELLGNFLMKSFEVLKEKNEAQALSKCATEVAHDIRSPLVALNIVSKNLSELPEQKRIVIRNATQRINDIANNLLERHKLKSKGTNLLNKVDVSVNPELVFSLLDSLVSEKRIQLIHKSTELILDIDNNAYSCFVNLDAREFKRTISNLINNASEAIESKGVIRIYLTKETDNELAVKIIDNGKGIPEDTLFKIKQEIVTSTKKEGHGIGISSAVQSIKGWGGSYDIQSTVGIGTTFTITLLIVEPPDWFQTKLEITPNMSVVVLDDDQSIHAVWKIRFQEYIQNKQIVLEHFYTPSTFIEYCLHRRSQAEAALAMPTCPNEAKSEGGSHAEASQNLSSKKTLFLIDYELLGSKETGLDLIEKLELENCAMLVTSRYEDPTIRTKIAKLGIKTIPKNFAPYIHIVFTF